MFRKLNERVENIFEVTVSLFETILPKGIETYAVDTFPVKVCENIRANRCRIAPDRGFRGYVASKRTYYHGVRLHFVASNKGYVKEFLITPGSVHDVQGLYLLPLINLREGNILHADRGYTDYEAEDLMKEFEEITLMPIRKNSKRFNFLGQFVAKVERKFIETVGSCIKALFPKRIHTVTLGGFIMKLKLFVLSYNIQQLLKVAS